MRSDGESMDLTDDLFFPKRWWEHLPTEVRTELLQYGPARTYKNHNLAEIEQALWEEAGTTAIERFRTIVVDVATKGGPAPVDTNTAGRRLRAETGDNPD